MMDKVLEEASVVGNNKLNINFKQFYLLPFHLLLELFLNFLGQIEFLFFNMHIICFLILLVNTLNLSNKYFEILEFEKI